MSKTDLKVIVVLPVASVLTVGMCQFGCSLDHPSIPASLPKLPPWSVMLDRVDTVWDWRRDLSLHHALRPSGGISSLVPCSFSPLAVMATLQDQEQPCFQPKTVFHDSAGRS